MADSTHNGEFINLITQMEFSLERITVYHRMMQERPMMFFKEMLEHITQNKPLEAIRVYLRFASSLLEEKHPRLAGNLYRDFILYHVIEEETAFAQEAAKGNWNTALAEAVKLDLKLLRQLYTMDMETMVQRLVAMLMGKEKRTPQPLAGIVWAGDKVAGVTTQKHDETPKIALEETDLPRLAYSEEAMEEPAAGDAKGTMYSMFLQEENWESLVDELWHFYSICGSGRFIQSRIFLFDGTLQPLPELTEKTFNDLYGFEYQKRMMVKNALQFMNGQPFHHMLIYGKSGMGKTSLALAFLYSSLANLRVVILSPGLAMEQYIALFELLSRQPARFVAFYDQIEFPSEDYKNLSRAAGVACTDNVMLCATAEEGIEETIFTMQLELEPLSKEQTVEMVSFLLHGQGVNIRKDRLNRVYCSHVEDGGTCRAARSIAVDILGENE